MFPLTAAHLFQMVVSDVLGPLPSSDEYKYVVVFAEFLKRWPEARALKAKEAK